MKKITNFYLMNLFYVFRNKVRVILTLLGCTVGLLVFAMGSIYISGYVSKSYERANAFVDRSIVIWGSDDSVSYVQNLLNYDTEEEYATTDYFFYTDKNYYYNDSLINNSISMIGTKSNDFSNATLACTNSEYIFTGCKLLYGRGLTLEDNYSNKMVAVIEKSAAQLLFQKVNCVGETICLNTFLGYQKIEVVGIIDDLSVNADYYLSVKEKIDGDVGNVDSRICVYVPLRCMRHYANDSVDDIRVIRFQEGTFPEAKETLEAFIENLVFSEHSVGINSRYLMIRDIAEEEQQINRIFRFLIIFLLMFVTLLMITVYSFSVKERVYEIGVRRAIGASKADILIQFIFEGTFLSFLSALITIIVSIIIAGFACYVSMKEFYVYYDFRITLQLAGSVLCLSVLQGVLFSAIPAVLASKVDPTDAIRWE